MKTNKITIIGAGNIGGTIAHLSLLKKLGDIVLFDISKNIAKGKVLDLVQMHALEKINYNIYGTNNYCDIKDSDVVIVTAGLKRSPGMNRNDLLKKNAQIMKIVGEGIKKYCDSAFVICITNPLDIMVRLLQYYSGIVNNKIVGMSSLLDTIRFKTFLSWKLGISVHKIESMVIGSHGNSMVPLISRTKIEGKNLEQLIEENNITKNTIESIIFRTKTAGDEIINLLKNSSAYYAPASCAIKIIESYLYNKNIILPCSAKLQKCMYQIPIKQDIFIGIPTKISSNGAEPVELNINVQEKDALIHSIQIINKINNIANNLLFI